MEEAKEIQEILSGLRHPEINNSLTELGMIGDISQNEEGFWIIELKLPFREVPIKELLLQLIINSLIPKLKEQFKIAIKVMTQEERDYFMQLSRQNWAL